MSYPLRIMVVPRYGRWIVKKQCAARAVRTFDSKLEAVAYGRALAQRRRAELFIFTKRGRMQSMRSYA